MRYEEYATQRRIWEDDAVPEAKSYQFASPAAAVEGIVQRMIPVGTERVPLTESWGRILAEDARADRDQPAFDASARDGFAVRAADAARGPIPIAGEVRIGASPPELPTGSAMRIVTGAPIPRGADTIVMHEHAIVSDDRLALDESMRTALRPGASIRRRGENAAAGTIVARAGDEITAPIAAALATFGVCAPMVFRPVRVAVIVTGDEIVQPNDLPTDWQVRDASESALAALLARRRWISVQPARRVGDEPAPLRRAVAECLESCDALVLTGGVSAGHRDAVPEVLCDAGVETIFHSLPQRPGKPLLAGVTPSGQAVFGLPGNPVSVLVTARRFVVPAIARMSGSRRAHGEDRAVQLHSWHGLPLDLWWHRLVAIESTAPARLIEERGSHDVPSAARSDGFVEAPPGSTAPGPYSCFLWEW